MAHPAIATAVVVGLRDAHYGEVVGAFLGLASSHGQGDAPHQQQRPGDDEVRDWVRRTLGKHKAPAHVFWLGRGGVPAAVPLTGSGKVRKFELAQLGNRLLEEAAKHKAKAEGKDKGAKAKL